MCHPKSVIGRPASILTAARRAEWTSFVLYSAPWVGECSRRCVAWAHDGPGSHRPRHRPSSLAPLADDLSRVEETLRGSVRTPDPFLADVATHLIDAGGKRLRPTLTLCATYASSARRPGPDDDALTGAVAVELVHLGLALPRRRDRRGRDPARRAQRQRPLEQHRGDPRRRLPPRPRVVARGVARCRRRRRCSPPPSASCAGGRCSSCQHLFDVDRSEEATPPRSRARPRRCSRRRAASAAWCRASATRPSTRSPGSGVTSACASRSSTTCSISPRPTTRSASPPGRTSSRASTRCP